MSEVLEKIDFKSETAPALATVAVVGLGYVGLPVAVAFGKQRRTIGYDLSKRRVENLKHMVDTTGEVSTAELIEAKYLKATAHAADLRTPTSSSSRCPRRSTPRASPTSRRSSRRARRSAAT